MGVGRALALLEPLAGGALVVLVLADVFLTILYARMGSGILSTRLARAVWGAFRGVRARRGHGILRYAGPAILVLLLAMWAFGLVVGTALVIHPALGTSVRRDAGSTPTGFVTALYAGAEAMAVAGSSDLVPQTSTFRVLFVVDALIGISIISLTLTYLMQIYTALLRRNALGLTVDVLTSRTGDAAELLRRVAPQGRFDTGYTILATLAQDLATSKEAHHFYPVLFYFHFDTPMYSVARFALVALDAATLIRTALADDAAWLAESAAVEAMWQSSLLLVGALADTFSQVVPSDAYADAAESRWRARYAAALCRLRDGGIATVHDERAGADRYVALRRCWDRAVTALAPAMGYDVAETDPATATAAATVAPAIVRTLAAR